MIVFFGFIKNFCEMINSIQNTFNHLLSLNLIRNINSISINYLAKIQKDWIVTVSILGIFFSLYKFV